MRQMIKKENFAIQCKHLNSRSGKFSLVDSQILMLIEKKKGNFCCIYIFVVDFVVLCHFQKR